MPDEVSASGGQRLTGYEDLEDWQLYERIEAAMLSGFCRKMVTELMRRYEPYADLDKPRTVFVWCQDCGWEKEVEPTWRDPDPLPRARKAAAGHLGNGCGAYSYGRSPA